MKRVSVHEKHVLSSLLTYYSPENLVEINKQMELASATDHEKILGVIEDYR